MIASPAKLVSGCLIILCLIGAAIYWLRRGPEFPGSTDSTSLSGEAGRDSLAKLARLEATERQTDETIWSKEILAQRYGQVFESLWDSILTATNKLQVLGAMRVGEVVLGDWSAARELPHGIELREPSSAGAMVASQAWPAFVAGFERSGWRLSQIEFRHNQFDTDASGQPRQSRFHFSMHLTNALETARAMVAGDLIVGWSPTNSATVAPFVQRIDASQLTIKTRRGEPPFRKILSEELAPSPGALTIDPLILYDLDHDGLSEIILPAKNLVYRRRDSGRYEAEELCRHLPGKLFTAVIADFDGDGTPDLLCAKPDGLWLFSGSATGTFDEPPRLVWQASAKLEDAMVLTCGDLDGDGDLDVFLAQYKVPTLGQVTRPHFYDARDGFPAYLLLNNGHGGFVDATAAAGLDAKRRRRTYSASFVDLDADGDLDLLVVSDFAGMDVYRNDGHAHFTDVTGEWIPEPHAFGMAHAVADFNGDGRLDIFMTGMTSPVADRLEHLGLWRPNKQEDRAMRSRMTFGNRLFMAKQESAFALTSFSDSIARSGWSWGCSAFDFDNDGFPDVYVANGNQSRASVRDYETEYWLHDLFVDDSVDDATATAYFTAKHERTLGRDWSYGGHEQNRLFLNQRGESFLDVGHLMCVALPQDSRCVVSDDLDGDGKMDLLVTTFETWPEKKQTLQVFQNTLADVGNWIGFRFSESKSAKSPVGVSVTLRCGGREQVRQLVNGDSYRSQSANTIHFGLGAATKVESVEIRWPDREVAKLLAPALNQYHVFRRPGGSPDKVLQ